MQKVGQQQLGTIRPHPKNMEMRKKKKPLESFVKIKIVIVDKMTTVFQTHCHYLDNQIVRNVN